MLSSVSDFRSQSVVLVAMAGAVAYCLPLIAAWSILSLLISIIAGGFIWATWAQRTIWIIACGLVFYAVLIGSMSAPFAAAAVPAAALAMAGLPALGAVILLPSLSVVMTLQEVLAEAIHPFGLEGAAPALISILFLTLANIRFLGHASLAATFALFSIWFVNKYAVSPEWGMFIAALGPCWLSIMMVRNRSETSKTIVVTPIFLSLLFALSSWGYTQPRLWNDAYVLLPDNKMSFETPFFLNYRQALKFSGIDATLVNRPEDVPANSLLLLPWTTSPFRSTSNEMFVNRIGRLARERQWTVVYAGEHTNLGGSADRLLAMTGRDSLRRDLTVPRGNSDFSGQLHASDLRAWPYDAVLNRGASVKVSSITDRILLAGDGWWSEPDIGEWLWVGDYIWGHGDRAGRLPLAISMEIDGARWVVVGDNSAFINTQIVADPRAIQRVLELATLWPAFIKDILLTFFISMLCIQVIIISLVNIVPYLIAASFLLTSMTSLYTRGQSIAWRDSYIGESGFDDRNFNKVLAENPTLIQGRRLIRLKSPLTSQMSLPYGRSVIFLLVDGSTQIGGVNISSCRRLGSLSTSDGPYLMDAQACRIAGPAKIVIGTQRAAAAFKISNRHSEALVILDPAFLATRAPPDNIRWLLKELRPSRSK